MPSFFDQVAGPLLNAALDSINGEAIIYTQGATVITGITGIFFEDAVDIPLGQSSGMASSGPVFFINPTALPAITPKVGDAGDVITRVGTSKTYRVQNVSETSGAHWKFTAFLIG